MGGSVSFRDTLIAVLRASRYDFMLTPSPSGDQLQIYQKANSAGFVEGEGIAASFTFDAAGEPTAFEARNDD